MITYPSFDSLEFFEKLKNAGTPEAQAKVQAQTLKAYTDEHTKAVQDAIALQDETYRKDLATKGDVMDVALKMEQIRAELKVDIEKVRTELKIEIEQVRGCVKDTESRLLKWQLGIGAGICTVLGSGMVALAYIMAKGFGWLGF